MCGGLAIRAGSRLALACSLAAFVVIWVSDWPPRRVTGESDSSALRSCTARMTPNELRTGCARRSLDPGPSTVNHCGRTRLLSRLADLDKALSSIEAVVDPDSKRARDMRVGAAGGRSRPLGQPDHAQRVTSRLSALRLRSIGWLGCEPSLTILALWWSSGKKSKIKPALPRQQTCLPRCRRRSRYSKYARCCRASMTSAGARHNPF